MKEKLMKLINFVVVICLCEEFGLVGLAFGIVNLMPMKTGSVQNDGYNLLDLKKNLTARKCWVRLW